MADAVTCSACGVSLTVGEWHGVVLVNPLFARAFVNEGGDSVLAKGTWTGDLTLCAGCLKKPMDVLFYGPAGLPEIKPSNKGKKDARRRAGSVAA